MLFVSFPWELILTSLDDQLGCNLNVFVSDTPFHFVAIGAIQSNAVPSRV